MRNRDFGPVWAASQPDAPRSTDAMSWVRRIRWIGDVPLLISVPQIVVPLAIWAFTLTNPPGGRHPAESKIQLIMPGQRRGELGRHPAMIGLGLALGAGAVATHMAMRLTGQPTAIAAGSLRFTPARLTPTVRPGRTHLMTVWQG